MAKYIAMGVAALFAGAEGLDLTPANYDADFGGLYVSRTHQGARNLTKA
eukprot:COSAG06_NODE_56504_length_284_cov_1.005405_1_plen_48_part_10